jgi:hypothetical protein
VVGGLRLAGAASTSSHVHEPKPAHADDQRTR